MRGVVFEVERERENSDVFWLVIAGVVSFAVLFFFLVPVLKEGLKHEKSFDVLFWMLDEGARWGWKSISHSWFGKLLGVLLYFSPIGILLGNFLFVIGVLLSFGRAETMDRLKGYVFSLLLGTLIVWSLFLLLFLWLLGYVFGGRNSEETLENIIKSIQ